MRAGRKPPVAGETRSAREEFLAAVETVKRLPPSDRVTAAPARLGAKPRQRLADEASALAEARRGECFEDANDHEADQSYLRPGVRSDVLRKLRRGHWSIQAQLDLHGYTRVDAQRALGEFLKASHGAGLRCLRIIHGKGHSSPGREPVLKGRVRRWLQHIDLVLAYCEPSEFDGGSGAVLVLLAPQ